MLLKYGCDCLIYLDRSVLCWILRRNYKDRTLTRHLAKLESFVEDELKKMKMPILQYKNISLAQKDGHVLNMAFKKFARNLYPNVKLNGILVDVNFFVTRLLVKTKSEVAQSLLNTFVNFFKANNDFCHYIQELSRFDKLRLLYGNSLPSSISEAQTSNIHIRSLYMSSCVNSLSSVW